MVIAIVSPTARGLTETFIKAHVERLPAETILLYGGTYQQVEPHYHDGQPLLTRPGRPIRVLRRLQRRLLNLPYDYFEWQALAQFLRRRKVSVVLAEYGPAGVAMLDVCRATGIPLVVHFHGYDAYRQDVLDGVGRLYARLFDEAAGIVAVSRHMEQQLLRLGAPRARLHYGPCGIDPEQFHGAAPREAPPLFLAVGRLVTKKAPYLTLLAFKQVVDAIPSARLTMAGEGPLREVCVRLVQALKLGDSVQLVGSQSHDAVAALMRQARAFVQHSVRAADGDSEGTPVSILEAGASGLPVVATRHTGIIDVVLEGETGYLVDEGDVDAMAGHMIELAGDPDRAGVMGAAARQRVLGEFSMEQSISGLWEILQATAKAS